MTHQTIFVTGGSGFLGRNIVRQLIARGYRARALARSDRSAQAVEALGAEAVRGDIMDRASLGQAMQGSAAVIHAAADTGHGVFEAGQHRTNVEGTRNVFSAAHEAGLKRGIHISTEAVLLSGAPLVNATEDTPYPARFAGSYSFSKAEAEKAALSLSTADFPIIAIRPRFVWGRDDTTALSQLVAAAQSGKLAWIDGGRYRTSTAHVDNVVHGVLLALEKGRGGEAYFVTDGEPRIFRDFVTRLLARAGVQAPERNVPRRLIRIIVALGSAAERLSGGRIAAPLGAQEYGTVGVEVTLDISKARNELGYEPVVGLEDGLATIEVPQAGKS